MYQETIKRILIENEKPMGIYEVRLAVAKKLSKPLEKVSYETVKKDLRDLAAIGQISAKSIGKGRRRSWVFWMTRAQSQSKELGLLETPKKSLALARDPFDVPIEERDSLEVGKIVELYDLLFEKYGAAIEELLKTTGARFLVLCDKRVILKSNDHEGPLNREVRALEKEYGKVCYVITKDLVEESTWSILGGNDYYPTIKIFLGESGWTNEDVFDRGLRLTADFDTGNPNVAAFDSRKLAFLKPVEAFEVRRALHLGRFYDYYSRTVKAGLQDVRGGRRCLLKASRSVLFWDRAERNPFLLANPSREAFVGRDLMMKFPFEITLSPLTRASTIRLI